MINCAAGGCLDSKFRGCQMNFPTKVKTNVLALKCHCTLGQNFVNIFAKHFDCESKFLNSLILYLYYIYNIYV
jgi:hypothetical protein